MHSKQVQFLGWNQISNKAVSASGQVFSLTAITCEEEHYLMIQVTAAKETTTRFLMVLCCIQRNVNDKDSGSDRK